MEKGYKICPFCCEEIREGAIKCQYCKEFLNIENEGNFSRDVDKVGGILKGVDNFRSHKIENESFKLCPYCGEQIKKESKKCCYCYEFLDEYKNFEVKLDRGKGNSSTQTNLKGVKESKKEEIIHKEIFRNPIDYSYIKCCKCGFEGLGGRKRVTKASDFLVRGAVATLIKETVREDLVICPICESSNVIETKYEKASGKDKFFAYGLPFLVFILIIIIICWIAN